MATALKAESLAERPSEGALTLVLRRILKAPPERVFRAWTEPEQLARWFGCEGSTVPTHELDPRPGGAYRITVRTRDGALSTVAGTYTVVEPPYRLAFTWAGEGAPWRGHDSLVEVRLGRHPEGTELVLTHRRLPSAELRDAHARGWVTCLDKLTRHLAAA